MRSIQLHFGNDEVVVATEGNSIPFSAFQAAVGRLCTWGDYPQVELFLREDGEILAVYRSADGERKYVIGAVWHHDGEGGHYGFHS